MIALLPSYTALATSEISARVGRTFVIMDSSISVAVITRLPSMRHSVITRFCMAGSSSNGISTPRSPRATITPSHAVQMSSRLSTPERFSIFAIRSMSLAPCAARNSRTESRSSLRETKEQAMKSTSFSAPKSRSALS